MTAPTPIAASRCRACGHRTAPPRDACGACGGATEADGLDAVGEILAITVVRSPPAGHDRDAVVAVVDLSGAGVLARAGAGVEAGRVAAGARVKVDVSPGGLTFVPL